MNKRVEWIDIAKGYGILFVIIGHLYLQDSFLTTQIYTFHMPLFFFLSGYVFSAKKYNFNEFIKRKAKTILVPYFALGVCMIIFCFALMSKSIDTTSIDYYNLIKKFLIQRRMWTLWFIACLFWLNIMFYLIVKLHNNDYKKMGMTVVVLTIIGLTYYKLGGEALPWNIDVCFVAIFFFYIGYLFKNIPKLSDFILVKGKKAIIMFILFFIINLICGIGNNILTGETLDISRNNYGFIPLTFISAFGGIMCVIIFSNAFHIKAIKYLGSNSLVYYAWHQTIMITIINRLYFAFGIFQGTSIASEYVELVVSTFIICITLTIADYIIRHSKLKFMVGIYDSKKNNCIISDKNIVA